MRHDSVVINNPLLYAIVGRPSCCGYTELHTAVADREPVQRKIVEKLDARGVRALALWEFGWSKTVMESRKRYVMGLVPDAGSTILDRYIAENFRVIETHGEFHVLWRRGLPFPGEGVPSVERLHPVTRDE
jgi:hypothetical protein